MFGTYIFGVNCGRVPQYIDCHGEELTIRGDILQHGPTEPGGEGLITICYGAISMVKRICIFGSCLLETTCLGEYTIGS